LPPSRQILPLFLLALGASAEELQGEAVEITAERPGSAPAAQSTVVEAARFGGEVRSVSELLLTAPGVTVHALGGPGQAATLSLRGASADQSKVLLDGIPLQGPGGGAVDLSTLPATLLERLVVNRGVLGAQFGAGALGGAVELLPRTVRQRASGGAQLSLGSFGTAQAAVDAAAPLGDGSALIAVQLDRTAGDFDYARQTTPEIAGAPWYGYTRLNADAQRISGLARVAQRVSPSTELDALVQGYAGERGLPGTAAYPTTHSRELDQGGLAGARLRGIAGEATWSARAWGRLDRIVQSGCEDPAADCPRIGQRSSTARAEVEGGMPLQRQWLKATLSAGEEWIRGSATGPHQRALLSAALSDEIIAGPGVSIHPALRIDRIGKDAGISPGLAALWRAGSLELRAGWGLSYRAPTFSELYLEQGGITSDPNLLPERAWSLDAGAAWRAGALTLSAGVFWSRYRDLILYELNPPLEVKPFNIGRARIAGVELQAIVPLPAGFLGEASYSYLDAVNLEACPQGGNRLSYRPPHRLFLRLARRGDRVEGYAESSYAAPMPRNQCDTVNLPGQLLLNAGAGMRVAGPLWIDLEAKNLLDDRTLEDLFQYPLPGFSIALIARARFPEK
jgi:iron complex outermembrane receptor protein